MTHGEAAPAANAGNALNKSTAARDIERNIGPSVKQGPRSLRVEMN
ncbi:MAG: hypothetical protein JWQ01_2065 [Massilia sp.]|nr:hypothetical protein [Massilia sp.]